MSFDELLSKINSAIGLPVYRVYIYKDDKLVHVVVLFSFQVWVRRERFYCRDDKPLMEYRVDIKPPSEQQVWQREKLFGLTKAQIEIELFKINGGKRGWYLVDLANKEYYYFSTQLELAKYAIEQNIAARVPVAMSQQN